MGEKLSTERDTRHVMQISWKIFGVFSGFAEFPPEWAVTGPEARPYF